MTTAQTETPPAAKTETPASPPAPAQVDPATRAAIVKEATEAATKTAQEQGVKIAAEKLKQIGQALTGETAPAPEKQLLETFVANPLKTLHSLKEVTKSEIREEQRQIEAQRATQLNAVQPFINEYPELNAPNKLALVEKIAEDHQRAGMTYADALKKGCEEAVKEFNLKSVSEIQASGNYAAGLPGGGGVRPPVSKFSEEKSQSDFINGMKARVTSFRKKA